MQLDQITANIRLRNPWEAMDLGFALIRQSWKLVYLPWFLFLTSLSVLVFLIFPDDYREYALFAVWWLKPLYDRFLLNIISHKLFNETLSTTDALKAIPRLIRTTGLLGGLTFRRPSFSRGFNLPVWQLEQLRGKERAGRQRVLLTSAHSHAIGLTLALIFIELAIYFSCYALIILLVPEAFQGSLVSLFFSDEFTEDIGFWMHMLDHVIYTLAVLLIEPFYVAASFTLYLNRRTQLEAWDIELVFRQMARRLAAKSKTFLSIAAIGCLVFAASTFTPQTLYAAESTKSSGENDAEYLTDHRLPHNKSAEVIKDIMELPELSNEKKTQEWIKIEKKKDEKELEETDWLEFTDFFKPIIKFFSILFESSLWIAIAVGIVIAFLTRNSWLYLFKPYKHERPDYEAPDVLFGMDIRPESLPGNIPEAARKLWLEHKHRDALSLLYRGALAQLVNQDQLPLKASQTEGDILKASKSALKEQRYLYLKSLTEQWKLIAYAHRIPDESHVTQLFDSWDLDFISTEVTE